ncbi:unnamed protein product, partial [Pylaiella littoralis]
MAKAEAVRLSFPTKALLICVVGPLHQPFLSPPSRWSVVLLPVFFRSSHAYPESSVVLFLPPPPPPLLLLVPADVVFRYAMRWSIPNAECECAQDGRRLRTGD